MGTGKGDINSIQCVGEGILLMGNFLKEIGTESSQETQI